MYAMQTATRQTLAWWEHNADRAHQKRVLKRAERIVNGLQHREIAAAWSAWNCGEHYSVTLMKRLVSAFERRSLSASLQSLSSAWNVWRLFVVRTANEQGMRESQKLHLAKSRESAVSTIQRIAKALHTRQMAEAWRTWLSQVEGEAHFVVVLGKMLCGLEQRLTSRAWVIWRMYTVQALNERTLTQWERHAHKASQKRVLKRTERIVNTLQRREMGFAFHSWSNRLDIDDLTTATACA